MTRLKTSLLAARELGPTALFHYTVYRLGLASGWIRRRTPGTEWSRVPLESWLRPGVPSDPQGYAAYRARPARPRFFFDGQSEGLPRGPAGAAPPDLLTEADELLTGSFRLFGGAPVPLGRPPDWHAFPSPLHGTPPFDAKVHWTRVPLNAPAADARLLWEVSRFGWVFVLARAYRWTGDTKYAEACWELIESWRRVNPPNHGVHWASGQEVSLRILALTFAGHAFFPAWSEYLRRVAELAQMVAVHAARIPPTLEYARAQANNHLLSEGAGLLTAGLMYPEFLESADWRRQGRAALEEGYASQVFDDGGYIQHSANYHRMALSLGTWAARLAEINGEPLSRRAHEALGRLSRGLAAQADPSTGQIACFGPDDASHVLPFTSTDSRDVRPAVAAGARLFLKESWYPAGAWDETSIWLGLGGGAGGEPPQPASLPQAGLHFLRGRHIHATLRCARFRRRPGHSDQLHIDLWWGSEPVAFDPGSYLYNGPLPWRNSLANGAVHNASLVNGQEPMRAAGPFLWVDRAQGTITGRFQEKGVQAIRAEHDGYQRLGVTTVRSLALVDQAAWLVVDEARGAAARRLTVGWNLPDCEWTWGGDTLRLALAQGELLIEWKGPQAVGGLVRAGHWIGGEQTGDTIAGGIETWGWRSPRYSSLAPCLRLVIEARSQGPLTLASRMVLGDAWTQAMDSLWTDPEALQRKFAAAAGER